LQVLVDNINSAPPEVVERINSLLEDSPSLHLYEHSSGETLSRAAGTIHPNFRLFATSNTRRWLSHKLSSALINRMIAITLTPLDHSLAPDNADNHPILALAKAKFAGVHGGGELALVCTRFHAHARQLAAAGEVAFTSGYQLTARNLLQAASQAARAWHTGAVAPLHAVVAALLQMYVVGVERPEQRALLVERLRHVLGSKALVKSLYLVEPASSNSSLEDISSQTAELKGQLASFELLVARICWTLLPSIDNTAQARAAAEQVCWQSAEC
jgi:hypothetical protein